MNVLLGYFSVSGVVTFDVISLDLFWRDWIFASVNSVIKKWLAQMK